MSIAHLATAAATVVAIAALSGRAVADPERCARGAAHARRGDLTRAALYLDDTCEPRLVRDLARRLEASQLAPLTIDSREPLPVALSALPGEPLVTPVRVWVRAGRHRVTAQLAGAQLVADVETRPRARAVVYLAPPPPRAAPATTQVDFEDGHAAEAQQAGPPPPIVRGTLVPVRYRGSASRAPAGEVPDPGADEPPPTPAALDDPFAVRAAPRRGRDARHWLGLRLGGGAFDDDDAAPRAGLSVAVAARHAVAARSFVAGRLDWTRRGGSAEMATAVDPSGPLDALGLSVGAGHTLLARRGFALAAIGQLRGEVRLADELRGRPVSRLGLAAAAAVELALPATPFTAGVRVEHGLTALVAGARDRAIVLELGVDLR